jgi:predicted TIM-barrel fold metal-dependent hydrolase
MSRKRLEGRDEVILDPEIPIVDAHHHLYDRSGTRYLLDEYLEDARLGHQIVASIYMESRAFMRTQGPTVLRSLGEVEFANGVADDCVDGERGARVCAGIVGYAEMTAGEAIGELLDSAIALAPNRFRGVREVTHEHANPAPFALMMNPPAPGIMRTREFKAALRELSLRNLTFDVSIFHEQIPAFAAIADEFPYLTFVLNHLGVPLGMDTTSKELEAVFQSWYKLIAFAAYRPNIVCKIGGLGLPFCGLGFDRREDVIGFEALSVAWKPFVERTIEVFGANRCMFESNFPVDGKSCGFVPLWNAFKNIVRNYTKDEKAYLFHRTAITTYRLDLPEAPFSLWREEGKSPSLC